MIAALFSCTEEQTLLLSGLRPFDGSRTQTKARRALHYKIKVLSIQICSKIITLSTKLRWPEVHFHVRKSKPCYLVVSGLSKAPSRKPRPIAFHYKIKSSQNPILLQDRHFEYQFKVLAAPFSCTEEQTLLLSGQWPKAPGLKPRPGEHFTIK